MKLVAVRELISAGAFPGSEGYRRVMRDLREAVDAVRWPPGADRFTIYPQSGKRRGQGNGVGPIKRGFVQKLADLGWQLEAPYARGAEDAAAALHPGAFDAWVELASEGWPPFVAEWETGNVSSSHRALNKMALGLMDRRRAPATGADRLLPDVGAGNA